MVHVNGGSLAYSRRKKRWRCQSSDVFPLDAGALVAVPPRVASPLFEAFGTLPSKGGWAVSCPEMEIYRELCEKKGTGTVSFRPPFLNFSFFVVN